MKSEDIEQPSQMDTIKLFDKRSKRLLSKISIQQFSQSVKYTFYGNHIGFSKKFRLCNQ